MSKILMLVKGCPLLHIHLLTCTLTEDIMGDVREGHWRGLRSVCSIMSKSIRVRECAYSKVSVPCSRKDIGLKATSHCFGPLRTYSTP